MIAGHFGFASLVKSRERSVPLWALMLATVWLDIVFVPLLLSGIETVVPLAGSHGGYGANLIRADYTHSLAGALFLSAVFGTVSFFVWGRRSGIVLGLVSFSHWLLDLIVHNHDMPLLPRNIGHFPQLGFGLWRIPAASIGIELALVVVGAWFYWRAARAVSSAAHRGQRRAEISALLMMVSGVAVLVLDVIR